jgi:orotate phosphoribosyltransferase
VDKNLILQALADANVVKFGEFTLVSGEKSPIYVDLRALPSNPQSFDTVTTGLAELARSAGATVLAGMETAGIPLAAAMAIKLKMPMAYVRKKTKDYGTKSRIEGIIKSDDKVALVDDLMTRGTSKMDFVEAVKESGNDVKDLVIVLDREQGGRDELARMGVRLHNLVTLKELLAYLFDKRKITKGQYDTVLAYLSKK